MPDMQKLTSVERDWLQKAKNGALAEICLRYARAINLLDVKWIADSLAASVTLESQSVMERLEGRTAVLSYLDGKIDALRRSPDRAVRAELATDQRGDACVTLFQSSGPVDHNWLSAPVGVMTFKINNQGEAAALFMITAAPAPSSTIRSGMYPGCDSRPVPQPQGLIRPTAGYENLELTIYLLDGQMNLDRMMEKEAEDAIGDFPGATLRRVVWENETEESNNEIGMLAFTGFPSLAVRWKKNVIYRHQGFLRADGIRQALTEIFRLSLVEGDTEKELK